MSLSLSGGSAESMHECDWCLDERPCAPAGPLWICGDCEAENFMFHAATGDDIPRKRERSGVTRYRTIVADPPWSYDDAGAGSSKRHRPNSSHKSSRYGAGSERRYGQMSVPELCALNPPAADDSHLYLWTTNSFMVEAHQIVRAWGFVPKTICTWGKVQPDGRASMKMGRYFRGATEHVIFATRGRLPFPTDRPTPTLWLWPRLPHSVKPDAFYDMVEQLSPSPRLEMFARRARLGDWDYWGDESHSTAEVA